MYELSTENFLVYSVGNQNAISYLMTGLKLIAQANIPRRLGCSFPNRLISKKDLAFIKS
jgi:hypothetical protein